MSSDEADRKKQIDEIVRRWCKRAGLSLKRVCELIGLSYDGFRQHYMDPDRGLKANLKDALAFVGFFARLEERRRCSAEEALEFLHLVGIHPEKFLEIKDLFPFCEWQEVWGRYLIEHRLMPEGDPVSAYITSSTSISLLNEMAATAYWKLEGGESYRILQLLATVLANAPLEQVMDEEKVSWFSYLVRKSVDLGYHKQTIRSLERDDLMRSLERVWLQLGDREDKLWALEWRAYYLEVLQKYQAAATVAEQVVALAGRRDVPPPFIAAQLARAAYCLGRAGNRRRAADLLVRAADLMTNENRISCRALAHYQDALSQDAALMSRDRIVKSIERLQCALEAATQGCHSLIALVCNQFDMDFADALVYPLVLRGVACHFISSSEVKDLIDLQATYRACIVVGGIKALATDRHLHTYFYAVPSLVDQLTFRDLDIKGQHYCDFWYSEIGDMPTYVLGGHGRAETFQAIRKFCDGQEIDKLVSLVLNKRVMGDPI